jgi:hypothetical protein
MGRHLKNYSINDQALALGIVNTSTANRPAGKNGQIIYNTTTGTLQVYDDNAWTNISTGTSAAATITQNIFSGDGLTQVFIMSLPVLNPQDILVFIGGVYQIPTTSYSVSGTSLTFGSAVPAPTGITGDNDHVITVLHGFNSVGS